ncbi:MAG: LD-carboxypeptidase, partial [Wenzhouxiangellaceae bacterium]
MTFRTAAIAVTTVVAMALAASVVAQEDPPPAPFIQAVNEAMAAPVRSAEERERDANRLPAETLEFLGLDETMRVVELVPGAGWYTKLLAHALREQGMRRLADVLGLEVRMLPTSTLSGEALTPEARAADLNTAFGDVTVAAIVCTIGGDDCIRVLPYLDLEL